jgi:hypothetical protein
VEEDEGVSTPPGRTIVCVDMMKPFSWWLPGLKYLEENKIELRSV